MSSRCPIKLSGVLGDIFPLDKIGEEKRATSAFVKLDDIKTSPTT
jgi:hypothetical protein